MNLFRRRPPEPIVVIHRIEGLDKLTKAIRYAAEVRAGRHEPAPPPEKPSEKVSAVEQNFIDWVNEHAWPEAQKSEFRAFWKILTGERKGSTEQRDRARKNLVLTGAPLPEGI